jgi:uncharacterized membrane protein YeaQ/YmgE (transglycosylase-associated protein family)
MNFMMWILVGGVLGWIASVMMKTNESQGIVLNIIVGIAGALIGGYFLAPHLGTGTINTGDYTFESLLISLLGAVILLAMVNLFRRSSVR